MSIITLVLVVLIVLAIFGAGTGHLGGPQYYGPGIGTLVLIVILVWLFFGR
jgi:hypothetical protein